MKSKGLLVKTGEVSSYHLGIPVRLLQPDECGGPCNELFPVRRVRHALPRVNDERLHKLPVGDQLLLFTQRLFRAFADHLDLIAPTRSARPMLTAAPTLTPAGSPSCTSLWVRLATTRCSSKPPAALSRRRPGAVATRSR